MGERVRLPLLIMLLYVSSTFAAAQLTASTVLANAWSAFSKGTRVGSLQVSGRVTKYTGPSDDTGTLTATASVDTTASVQWSMMSGSSSESRKQSSGNFACSWIDISGSTHDSPAHNCWQNVQWLAPSLSTQISLLPSNIGVSYVGHETIGNAGVEHLRFQTIFGDANTPTAITSVVQRVSTSDLYLDSTTFLPVLLRYSIRADEDINTAISIEVRYSNYLSFAGMTVPTHIERSLDGALREAIDISSLSAS